MAFLETLPRISFFSLRRTEQHSLGLQSWIWNNLKTSVSFGQARPKWRCLAIIHSVTFGKNQTRKSALTPHTNS